MNPRKLTASEVTFTITTEPDNDSSPHDSLNSGDPDYAEADKRLADDICERFNRGDTDAWCGVIVKATWEGLTGRDSIWGCSLDSKYTAEVVVEEYGMKANALDDLNAQLAAMANTLGKLGWY